MKWLAGALTKDLPRKLLAVGLAYALWSFVYRTISTEEEIEFSFVVLTESEVTTSPLPNQVQIVVPEGYQVLQPDTDRSFGLDFAGVRSAIQEFRGTADCAARIDVPIPATGGSVLRTILPQEWAWSSDEVRNALMELDEEEAAAFTFEVVKTEVREIQFVAADEDIDAQFPDKQYRIDTARTVFFPASAKLIGPPGAFQQFDANPGGQLQYLEPIRTDGVVALDFETSVGLRPEFADLGLRMDPPTVRVRVAVVYQGEWQEWTPSEDNLRVISGPKNWVPAGVLPPLQARWIRQSTSDITLDSVWLSQHVVFVYNPSDIPDSAVAEYELEPRILFEGVSANLRDLLEREIEIKVVNQGDDMKMTMRPAESGPNGMDSTSGNS